MIYRVHYKYGGASEGFQYFGNKKEALASIKEYLKESKLDKKEELFLSGTNTELESYIDEEIKTPKTKERILWALNRYGGHADNG
jgi:hypothetical protein